MWFLGGHETPKSTCFKICAPSTGGTEAQSHQTTGLSIAESFIRVPGHERMVHYNRKMQSKAAPELQPKLPTARRRQGSGVKALNSICLQKGTRSNPKNIIKPM